MSVSKKRNIINKKLRDLLAQLQAANENGLFKSNDESCNEIYSKIVEGLDECSSEDMVDQKAHDAFFEAFTRFNKAIDCKGLKWQFTYCFGGPIVFYFCFILLGISLIWYYYQPLLTSATILWIPTWVFVWGTIGGILQGFWFLWKKISARRLRRYWFVWFLTLPLIGALLAAIVYLVYYTGFIISSGTTTLVSESLGMLISALAGFSSLWAIETLNGLTKIIQIKTPHDTDE